MRRYRTWKTAEQKQRYKQVECPTCAAKPGMPCVKVETQEGQKYVHSARRDKYRYDIGGMNKPIETCYEYDNTPEEKIMKKTKAMFVINTVEDLHKVLPMLVPVEADNLHVSDDEVHTVNESGDPIMLRLIEETLTDGSHVYNIEVS